MNALSQKPLKTRQICLFFITFTPVLKFFMMPSVVAAEAGRDEWLCCIINVFIDFLTLAALVFSCKSLETDFFGLCENAFGKTAAKAVYLFYALYFLTKAYLPITEQRDYVELTLYNTLPSVMDFMPFILLAYYFAHKKLRVIGRISDLFWLFALLAYVLMFALAISNTNLEALLPFAKTPAKKIAKGSFLSLNWYGDAAYFLFFVGNYKHGKGDTAKILLSYLLSAAFVLVFVVIFYGTFSSIAFRQRYALTELSKYSTIINNIGRFDYFAIFILLMLCAFSSALPLCFASKLLCRVFNVKKKWILYTALFAAYTAFLLIIKEYNASAEAFMMNYGGYAFLLFGNVAPLLIAFMALRFRKKGGEKA